MSEQTEQAAQKTQTEKTSQTKQTLHVIGYAYGGAGADPHTSEGPLVLQASQYLNAATSAFPYQWDAILTADQSNNHGNGHNNDNGNTVNTIAKLCTQLANKSMDSINQKTNFVVVGGDHSSAIGTWSGVSHAFQDQGDVGLIWIDAHMDSHTPETSLTGRVHGMPLAVLLGSGDARLTNILHMTPKIKPQNVCLIGIRSFERGEAEFLKQHQVRIFYMKEVKQRGLAAVLREAIEIVSANTIGFGISLDLDSIDPKDAPAVAVPEPNGIRSQDLLDNLHIAISHPKYLVTEIVEFDPIKDVDKKTEKLAANILKLISINKVNEV